MESYNFDSGSAGAGEYDKEEKLRIILDFMEKDGGNLFPKYVALMTGLNPATVRGYLRELEKRGRVKREFNRGPYYLVSEKTLRAKEFLVHNLRFTYTAPEAIKIETKTLEETLLGGKIRLRLLFGVTHNKVTCEVSGKEPMTLREALMLGDFFIGILKVYLRHVPAYADILVATCEFNWDYPSYRIDGAECVTLHTLGQMEKVYNKRGFLRREVRPRPFTMDILLGLMEGGTLISASLERQNMTDEKLDKISGNLSYIIRYLLGFERRFKRLEKKLSGKA